MTMSVPISVYMYVVLNLTFALDQILIKLHCGVNRSCYVVTKLTDNNEINLGPYD